MFAVKMVALEISNSVRVLRVGLGSTFGKTRSEIGADVNMDRSCIVMKNFFKISYH